MRELNWRETDLEEPYTIMPTREVIERVFPNMAALDPETKFWVYREYRPTRGKVEITMFWREPRGNKFRLDAEYPIDKFEGIELMPHDVKIVSVIEAAKAIT